MEDALKMDIFFVVTTVAVCILTVLISVLLIYAIRLMRTLNRISENVEEEARAIREDLIAARTTAKKKGQQIVTFFETLGKTAVRYLKRRKRS